MFCCFRGEGSRGSLVREKARLLNLVSGSCRRAAPPVLGAKNTCTGEAPARRAGRPRPAPPAHFRFCSLRGLRQNRIYNHSVVQENFLYFSKRLPHTSRQWPLVNPESSGLRRRGTLASDVQKSLPGVNVATPSESLIASRKLFPTDLH